MASTFRTKMTAWFGRKDPVLRDRRAGVTVLFAATVIPMIGLIGLAVDFGIWEQVNADLEVAADAAALNAAKLAGNAETLSDQNYLTEGRTAGIQWFNATVSTISGQVTPTVTVTGTTTVTASVTYTGHVNPIIGSMLFGVSKITGYPISGEAQAVVTLAPYLTVSIMLDNSSSMEIGATDTDIATLEELTPCALPNKTATIAPGPFYYQNGTQAAPTGGFQQASQAYSTYQSQYYNSYTGDMPSPLTTQGNPYTTAGNSYTFSNFPFYNTASNGGNDGPSCAPFLKPQTVANGFVGGNGLYPSAGPPCAFACHFDPATAGSGSDFYAVARSTIGTANPVTLRFDVVKKATNLVIGQMAADNLSAINNLAVGIFTFNASLLQVYPAPPTGQTTSPGNVAGSSWSTAQSLVGGPPTVANGPDTGIQPDYTATSSNNGDTDFVDSMANLAALLPAAGQGTTAASPRQVLFIVSDGLADYLPNGNRTYAPFDPNACQTFKNKGYTIYVVYTPYYPLQNNFYLQYIFPTVEGDQPGTNTPQLVYNLQACASSPTDYIQASNSTQLTQALQGFLQAALNAPARFSM